MMSQIIYIGIRLIKIRPESRFQLLISDNAGISWKVIFEGSNETGEFFELRNKSTTIFAKSSTGKFKSLNEGRSWTKIK